MGNKESVPMKRKDFDNSDVYQYETGKGCVVNIKGQMDPYQHLKISENASHKETKNAFRAMAKSTSRQERAMASLAYYMITSQTRQCFKKNGNEFTIINEDIFLLTAIGYTSRAMEMISHDEGLINARNEYNHIPLYLAARAGFYDLTKMLITRGSVVNHQQVHGSTALHAATYFGQTEIVQLLLQYGADPTIRNNWNNYAADETDESDEIMEIFKVYKDDAVSKLMDSLEKDKIPNRFRTLFYGNDIVAKEVIVQEQDILNDWIMVWHGTKYDYLESIVKYGLQPGGSILPNGKAIEIQPNHIELNKRCFEIDDWARAIFVSPSLRYAAHSAYSERVFSDEIRWNVVVKLYFNPSVSHISQKPTATPKYEFLEGEDLAPEIRIESTNDDVIFRISSENDNYPLIVKSIVFIKTDFLETVTNECKRIPISNEDIQVIFS